LPTAQTPKPPTKTDPNEPLNFHGLPTMTKLNSGAFAFSAVFCVVRPQKLLLPVEACRSFTDEQQKCGRRI
jgi:hypothetical protein